MLNIFLQIIDHEILLLFLMVIPFIAVIAIPKIAVKWKVSMVALLLLAMLNIFLGHQLSNRLIYRYGVEGTATVTSQEMTDNLYNKEPVTRFNTLLKTDEGNTIETYFESWDFNIYPTPENGRYSYPKTGIEFNVKYLHGDPDRFIILSNNASAYTRNLNCSEIELEALETKRKVDFDPANQTYKNEYGELIKDYGEMECEGNLFLEQEYEQTIQINGM